MFRLAAAFALMATLAVARGRVEEEEEEEEAPLSGSTWK